jgi:hypothetical protein
LSVRLATGSIVSTRKVLLPLTVKFDDFNSVEPFIVLDMDDRYDLILGIPWLVKHEPWIDWHSRTISASHKPLADRALAGHVPSSSRDGFVHEHRVPRGERHFAGSVEQVGVPNNQGGRAEAPTTKGVRAGSAVGGEGGTVGVRSATVVVDTITGERQAQLLTPPPALSELLELEELSYVEFLESLKADLGLLRREHKSVNLNSSSVMAADVLEEERVSKRQRRYGAAILKDPSDPYYPLLKEFSDVVSEDPPSVLPPDRCVTRSTSSLVQSTAPRASGRSRRSKSR